MDIINKQFILDVLKNFYSTTLIDENNINYDKELLLLVEKFRKTNIIEKEYLRFEFFRLLTFRNFNCMTLFNITSEGFYFDSINKTIICYRCGLIEYLLKYIEKQNFKHLHNILNKDCDFYSFNSLNVPLLLKTTNTITIIEDTNSDIEEEDDRNYFNYIKRIDKEEIYGKNNIAHKEYESEIERMKTFYCIYKINNIDRKEFIKNGFFYFGSGDEYNIIICYCCGKINYNPDNKEKVFNSHKKNCIKFR